MEPKNELISLFDYLGRAAGAELGKQVSKVAVLRKETIGKRSVSNKSYTGEVFLYRREFLQEYFNAGVNQEAKKK
jgi:hypothetical protein